MLLVLMVFQHCWWVGRMQSHQAPFLTSDRVRMTNQMFTFISNAFYPIQPANSPRKHSHTEQLRVNFTNFKIAGMLYIFNL